MSIRKIKGIDSNFTIVPNETINATMSWEAKAMLIYLCSKPDDWVVCRADLINQTQGSRKHSKRDAVGKIISELVELGYMRTAQKRSSGKFSTVDYEVCITPLSPLTENPVTGSESQTDLTSTANPALQSTEYLPSTKKEYIYEKKSNPISQSGFNPKPAPIVIEFEHIWAGYPQGASSLSEMTKQIALVACRGRINKGSTWRHIAEQVTNYAHHCTITKKSGTLYVKGFVNFINSDEHFFKDWKAENENIQQANAKQPSNQKFDDKYNGLSDAMREVMQAREKRDAARQASRAAMGANDGVVFEEVDEEQWDIG